MGKLKALIPITLALAIAIGGSLFIYNWMDQQGAPPQVAHEEEQVKAVPVVVATADMNWGTVLKKEMLKTVPYFRASLPEGYYTDPEKIEGRVLLTRVKPNEIITESRLASEDIRVGGVSAILPEGMRAISVPGNRVSGISGFIQPGNNVDVMVTLQDPDSGNDITKLVLERVPVLATGTQIQNSPGGEPAPVDVYTLKVTPEDAEKLTLAASRGNLQFALRNILDQETVLTSGATISHTLKSLVPIKSNNPTSEAQAPLPGFVVEVIQGGQLREMEFKR